MKPKLYQYAACPFCHKVRSILEYKGVDFEVIEVHPLNKKEIAFSENYRKVPIYIDSKGVQVNDSTPIMRRIDQEFLSPKVFRGDEKEEKWLGWSEKFVQGLPVAIYNTLSNSLQAFNYITKVGNFSWLQKRTIKYSGAFVMTMVAKKIKKREEIENPDAFLREKSAEWISGLEGQSFMGGELPNGADISLYGIMQSIDGLQASQTLQENQGFREWMSRMTKTKTAASHQEVLGS